MSGRSTLGRFETSKNTNDELLIAEVVIAKQISCKWAQSKARFRYAERSRYSMKLKQLKFS